MWSKGPPLRWRNIFGSVHCNLHSIDETMSDPQIPETKPNLKPPSEPPKIPAAGGFSHGTHFPNPPDSVNPDAATLRDQWRFAIRQYSKWYSHAWGTAILAGVSFFALGWFIKGSNPITSFKSGTKDEDKDRADAAAGVNQPRWFHGLVF